MIDRQGPRDKSMWLVGPDVEGERLMHAIPDYLILAELVESLLGQGRVRALKPVADDAKSLFDGGDDRKLLPLGTAALCSLGHGQDVREWKWVYIWPSRPEEQGSTNDWFVEEMING